jgi:Zn-dependent protease with chaperone function
MNSMSIKGNETQKIFDLNPSLYAYIQRYKAKDQPLITIYPPGSQEPRLEKFNALCARMKLDPPPFLMVLDNFLALGESRFQKHIKNSCFIDDTNVIILSEQGLNEFNFDDQHSEYIVSHENGHAIAAQDDRRVFLQKAAAYTAAGIGGLGTLFTTKIAGDKLMELKDGMTKLAPADIGYVAAGLVGGLGATNAVLNFFSRKEEFFADDQAVLAYGKEHVMKVMAENVIQSRMIKLLSTPKGGEKWHRMEQEYDALVAAQRAEGKEISDLQELVGKALYVTSDLSREMTLGRLLTSAYPRFDERLDRLSREYP